MNDKDFEPRLLLQAIGDWLREEAHKVTDKPVLSVWEWKILGVLFFICLIAFAATW